MTTVLQRLVFPLQLNPDVLPLYVDSATWSTVAKQPVRIGEYAVSEFEYSRFSAAIPALKRYSFGTYFNAFPAAYWQRWTLVTEVQLIVETSGAGQLMVYKSNSRGDAQQVAVAELEGEKTTTFTLKLDSFGDGGWYWFDLISSHEPLVVRNGVWSTPTESTQAGSLCLGITTFNKPEYCVSTLATVSGDPEVVSVLSQLLVIDQGTKQLADQPGMTAVREALGDKLRLIQQSNLGGSGGFSRVMHESVQIEECAFAMLLDDDIEVEPESILRAYRFASFNREPTIVGGHMFDLYAKTVLHAWAEIVRPDVFMWGPSFKEQHRHNLRDQNLRQTSWMHARLDADYNGWWMCLIPTEVIKEVGYSLPYFIKWDDAEYSLRAREAGFRTVSLPGVAVWHISWLDKDDSQDWQVYFHTRNRLIAGLIHGSKKTGRKLIRNNARQDIKKLLNMQYYATQLAVDALASVLDGPEQLHKSLLSAMPRARTLAKSYGETIIYAPEDRLPTSINGRVLPALEIEEEKSPTGIRLGVFTMINVTRHWFGRSILDDTPASIEFPKVEAHWWVIPNFTNVLIGTADGRGKMWFRRNRKQFRSLFVESRRLNREILRNWSRLSDEYRSAMQSVTSPESWQETFRGGI